MTTCQKRTHSLSMSGLVRPVVPFAGLKRDSAVLPGLTFASKAMRALTSFFLTLFLVLPAGPAAAATLLGDYPLEDLTWNGSANEVRDVSGNNHHGTAIGTPLPNPAFATPARPGKPGTCTYGSFPGPTGNGGALTIGGLPVNLTAGAKTTVSFWMYWNGTDNMMPIGWARHDLWLQNGNFGFNTGNSDIFGIASTGLANRWVHVVAEFTNGNVTANKLYIDGALQTLTQRQSSPANTYAVVNPTLRVGGWQNDTSYRFSGRIDEIKVYDGDLTLTEVSALYTATHACAPRLVLDWRLDECALGTVTGEVQDSSGYGNNGTPLGLANTSTGKICKGGIFNGISPTRIKAGTNFADSLTNDFSIAFWVNPTATHQIDTQANAGATGTSGKRYVLYPAQGTDAWGSGHAGVGVSIGTNGVSVYEHAASHMPATLVWAGAVSGWTHVAVTYQAKQPRLYINGALVKTGLTSIMANVHPGLRSFPVTDYANNDGGVGGGNWGWFNGGVDEFRIYDGTLDAAQVASIASATPRSCASCATLAHYRLEEAAWTGVAGEVQDTSGNARHGQALGTPLPLPASASPARAGSPGTCGYGTLAGGALNLPVAANTAAGAKTTVSFWMYWDGTNSVMPIGWYRHDLWLTGGHFGFNTAQSDVYGISSAGLANRWTHVSAVFTNGSVTANKLYIDGVAQPLTQRQGSPSLALAVVNANLRIGGWQSDNGYRFRSRIDEVNVFDGEMTQSQVLAQYNATHPCGGAAVPASFNCVAAGEAASTGHLFTKLAGTPFNFDVVALKTDGSQETGYAAGGNKNVTVELVEGAGATACASRAALTPAVSQTLTFVAADAGRKAAGNMTVGRAYRELRCRVTDANQTPAVVGCSTDSFSVRPPTFTVTSSANADASGTSTTATPTVKAGAAISLTAAAIPGYDGTPILDAGKTQAHAGAVRTGTLTGNFPAANPASGSATGAAFLYDEVGYFRLDTNGVSDTAFTSVDAGSGDCTPDFSNAPVGGRVGCYTGNNAPTSYFGRFVPDRFDTEIPTPACGTFTYSGQPFPARISARNLAGMTTQNYSGTFAKNVTFTEANGSAGTFALTPPPASPLPAGTFVAGVADLTNLAATPTLGFTFASPLTAPAIIRLRATDSEGISSASGSEANTPIRSGRLKIQNAYGSELRALPLTVTTQYFTGVGYALNSADNCTTITPDTIALGNWQRNLSACETGLSGGGTLTGGELPATSRLTLGPPGAGNSGSVDLTVRLGAGAGTNCRDTLPVGPPYAPGTVTSARAPWLQPVPGSDPAARATFGIYRDRMIFRREITR